MASNYQKIFEKDYELLNTKYDANKEELKLLKYEYRLLQNKYKTKCKQVDNARQKVAKEFEPIIKEKDKIIENQQEEIKRLKGLLNLDGNNAGIPTSQTPINKKKRIPNSRKNTGGKIGGVFGHKKHKLEKFDDEEVTEIVRHELKECPKCGGKLKKKKEIYKDELSFKVVTIKRRHAYDVCECENCHKEVHEEIPTRLKEENQYGSEVQSLALSLGNEGNVSMNKIRRLIRGITHGDIDISEGYIAKLQKRASKKLEKFNDDLYKELLKQELVHWDDTVVMVNKKRACLRFYGTSKLALYKAHEHKDKDGLDDDGILQTLSEKTKVVHDHNKVNYNKDYCFINIECNEHLKRDLQKCYDNTTHEWSKNLKSLIQKALHDRKEIIKKEEGKLSESEILDLSKISFDNKYLVEFDAKMNDFILEGISINKENQKQHYNKTERALLTRILDYKENYFMWLHDFSIPPDNNLSERSLRGIKSKMKISGQFQNINNAQFHANIKSYIETCYRNGVNPTDALISLMEDNPINLSDII